MKLAKKLIETAIRMCITLLPDPRSNIVEGLLLHPWHFSLVFSNRRGRSMYLLLSSMSRGGGECKISILALMSGHCGKKKKKFLIGCSVFPVAGCFPRPRSWLLHLCNVVKCNGNCHHYLPILRLRQCLKPSSDEYHY